jgi:hypothetical protein
MQRVMISNDNDINFQAYLNYTKVDVNGNLFANSLAFKDLNNQNLLESVKIDLAVGEEKVITEDEQATSAEILRPDSPTQARDFKLFCEGCKRSFTSKKRLQNHVEKCLKKIKKDTKNRAFSCRHCGKAFKKLSGVVKHALKYHKENSDEEQQKRRSIFHSIELLAVSDSLAERN